MQSGDGDDKKPEPASTNAERPTPPDAAPPTADASAPLPSLRRGDSIPPSPDDPEAFDDDAVDHAPGPTIFVTDPTVEAARIEWALRARGYVVIDVPLAMLVGRAAVQKPHLVLLDVDAPGALDVAARVRQLPAGGGVHMIYAGHAGQTFSTSQDALAHEGSGFFARPIDIDALVDTIDALLGVEREDEPVPPPIDRPPSNRPLPPRRSSRPPPPSLRAPASPIPPRPFAVPAHSPGPVSLGPPMSNEPDRAPSSQSPSTPRPTSDRPAGQRAWTAKAAEARLSPDLERLLKEAEARVAGPTSQRAPESGVGGEDDVLSPEDEVEAVLPAEILASLDEPLDAEGDDDDSRSDVDTGAPHGTTGARDTRTKGTPATTTGGAGTPNVAASTSGTSAGDDQPLTTSGGREISSENASGDPRTATTPKPPRRVPNAPAESRAITSPALPHSARDASRDEEPRDEGDGQGDDGDDEDEQDERSLSQVQQPAAIPSPAMEHPPPLAPTTARPPPPTHATHARPQTFVEPNETPRAPAVVPQPPIAPPPQPATPEPPRVVGAAPLPPPRVIASADEALRALADAVGARVSGVLRVDEPAGIRRIVLQDGDIVTAASSVEGESLLGYLQGRGDLAADVVKRLSGRVPPFGRLAGAALVAHGHLHQDQLWDVLQAHAAWLLTRVIATNRGQIAYEAEPPARLKGEPPVFGGTPGPALVVEITRRAIPPGEAIARLGGLDARLTTGERARLVDECGLEDADDELVRRIAGATLRDVVAQRGDDAATLIYALVALAVIGALSPARGAAPQAGPVEEEAVDPARDAELDDAALRARIVARRTLVEDGDYFAILGVPRAATGYEIRRAYLELRRALDPSRVLRPSLGDLVDDLHLVLQVVDEAYDVLKDATRRERYRRAISHEPPG